LPVAELRGRTEHSLQKVKRGLLLHSGRQRAPKLRRREGKCYRVWRL
jgi:hypothetical protein